MNDSIDINEYIFMNYKNKFSKIIIVFVLLIIIGIIILLFKFNICIYKKYTLLDNYIITDISNVSLIDNSNYLYINNKKYKYDISDISYWNNIDNIIYEKVEISINNYKSKNKYTYFYILKNKKSIINTIIDLLKGV